MRTLFPKTYEMESSENGAYHHGVWRDGTKQVGTFRGSVQQVTGEELVSLTVGRKDTGKIKIYTSSILSVSTEGGSTAGDIVLWGGRRWEVIQALSYRSDLIPHYKYIAEDRGAL